MQRFLLAVGLLAIAAPAAFGQYWADQYGFPVVNQVGTGAATVSGTGYTVTLKQYVGGVTGQIAPLASAMFDSGAASPRLVLSASATSEGTLTTSVDRSNVVLAGYDAASGTAAVNSTATNANRVVGFAALNPGGVGLTGTTAIAYSQAQASAYANNNIRSATALSGPTGDAWTAGTGTNGGVRYIPTNTQSSTTVTNIRSVDVYSGQLFCSSASGAFLGVSTVGAGTPTGSGNTISLLINTGAGSSPYEFVALTDNRLPVGGLPAGAAGNNLFYIADDRTGAGGGIQRWSWNGTAFVNDYTISVGTGFGARGLAAVAGPGGDAILYASRSDGTQLLQFMDTGTQIGAEATRLLLATADTNTVFRGVALAVPEPGLIALAGLGLFAVRRRK